jgi:hypothetical protein
MKRLYIWDVIDEDGHETKESGYAHDIREAFEMAIESYAPGVKSVNVQEGTLEDERAYFYGVASHRVVPIGTFVRIKPYEYIKEHASFICNDPDGESAMYENFYLDYCESFEKKDMEHLCGKCFRVFHQEFDTRLLLETIDSWKALPYFFLQEWVDIVSEEEARKSV